MYERDKQYMAQALMYARKAADRGEIPVGAVLVSAEGDSIGTGYNLVEEKRSQLYHAEMNALREAAVCRGDWRLDGTTLYVTLEPCMMCMSAAALSRVERVVYGASSPVYGYRLDKEGVLQLYTNQIKNITGQVGADQAAALLKDFFSKKRDVL